MQTIKEIEDWYKTPDPWGYESNPDDDIRKKHILEALEGYGTFKKALDIGCGEGFITRDLPAERLYGFDVSQQALERLPEHIHALRRPQDIKGKFDLVVATGVMYPQYAYADIIHMIAKSASRIILLCNISEWEMPDIQTIPNQMKFEQFKYREYTQNLRVYDLCFA